MGFRSFRGKGFETVGNVDLNEREGAMARVSLDNRVEDPREDVAILHGLPGCQSGGVLIDIVEGIIHNSPRAAFLLGDNTERRNVELGPVQCLQLR